MATKECPDCGQNVRVDANFCKFCSHDFSENSSGKKESSNGGDGSESPIELSECPSCEYDLSSIPGDRLSDDPTCPICSHDLRDAIAESKQPAVTPADLDECPNCGRDLSTIPEDMRIACPNCQINLEEAIERHFDAHGEPVEAAGVPEDSPLRDDVETIKGIASGYANRLAQAGIHTVGGLVNADPAVLSEETSISQKRIVQWIDRAPVESEEYPSPTERPLNEESPDETEPPVQSIPDEVVFDVLGNEIRAGDGDTIGREIRTAMVDGGAAETEAMHVHREHARVDKERDGFYLTRIGQNSLKVNGEVVERGERVGIAHGDLVAFAKVVSATVRIE